MPPSDQSSVSAESLIAAIRDGAGGQLGRLLEMFRPELTRIAESRINAQMSRRMSVSDLVQETLLTANEQFKAFRGESAPEFRRWLLEVLQSRLVDGIRRHRMAECRTVNREETRNDCSQADPAESPSTILSMNEEAGRLLKAMEELPAPLQDVVRMRYMNDMTFEAMAENAGVSVATVWRRWEDAVQKLRASLNNN